MGVTNIFGSSETFHKLKIWEVKNSGNIDSLFQEPPKHRIGIIRLN